MSLMRVIKTYGCHEGWSATFRQWRAKSHCHFIHGYAIGVELEFACLESEVDENGWVINFGGLKPVKEWLKSLLDHKTLVAADDPEIETFRMLEERGLIQVTWLPAYGSGCDNLCKLVRDFVVEWLEDHSKEVGTKAWLERVRIFEHAGNAAEWTRS